MKEIQDLIEFVEGHYDDDGFFRSSPQWGALLKAAQQGAFWPTPIAFADEKPKEGQRIFYWSPADKEWYATNYVANRWSIYRHVTHWLPAPPDVPEPPKKEAWEVAWDEYVNGKHQLDIKIQREAFKAIWDRAIESAKK